MKLINFQLELTPTKEVLMNGRNILGGTATRIEMDEKVYGKLSLDHQHAVICEVRKLLGTLLSVHEQSRVRHGELQMDEYERRQRAKGCTSAAAGIDGVIGPLPKGKLIL